MIRMLVFGFLLCAALMVEAQRPSYELITDAGPYLRESGNASSGPARASANGRFIVFGSDASNLVEGDTNGLRDVFVRDRVDGSTERVSVDSNGNQLATASIQADISNDGRYVVFQQRMRYSVGMIMLKDRHTGVLSVISQSPMGAATTGEYPAISGNGRVIVFRTSSFEILGQSASSQVVAYDRTTGALEILSVAADQSLANDSCGAPSINNNGLVVAFSCSADNLALDVNNREDVFVADRLNGSLTLHSVRDDGIQGNDDSFAPRLAGNGESLVFLSRASSLSPLVSSNSYSSQAYLRDLQTSTTQLISVNSSRELPSDGANLVSLNDAGTRVVFQASGYGFHLDQYSGFYSKEVGDVGLTRLDHGGELLGNGSAMLVLSDIKLSDDDRNSTSDIYLQPINPAGEPELVSRANPGLMLPSASSGYSQNMALSGDGLTVVFDSSAQDLVEFPESPYYRDTQAFAVDRGISGVDLLSQTQAGETANREVHVQDLSADGRYVLIESAADNLGPPPTDYRRRLLLLDRETSIFQSIGSTHDMGAAKLSAGIRYTIFQSAESDLVSIDVNNSTDVFLYDRDNDRTEMVSISTDGIQSNANSSSPAVSDDGRYVAFVSDARTLSSDPSGDRSNVYLRDRVLGTTRLVTIGMGGSAPDGYSTSPSISANGSRILFLSSASNLSADSPSSNLNVYLFDANADPQIRRVSQSSAATNAECSDPQISRNGLWASFACVYTQLDPDTDSVDPFSYNRYAYRLELDGGEPQIVSLNSANLALPSTRPVISADGQQIAFFSSDSRLIPGGNGADQIIVADFGQLQAEVPLFADSFE